VLVQGTTARVDVAGFERTGASSDRGRVTLGYAGDRGYPTRARVTVTGNGVATGRLRLCAVGCTLLSLTVSGAPSFEVRRVVVGGAEVLAAPVTHRGARPDRPVAFVEATHPSPDLLEQALLTPGVRLGATVAGLDGSDLGVHVVGSVDAVPLLGRQGVLLDLARVLRGAVGQVAAGRAVVVARADTPASVLARLHRDGGGRPTSYASAKAAFDATPESRSAGLALLSAQAGRRRAEVAGLRSAGMGPRVVRRAYLVEACSLAAVVLVAAVVVGALVTPSLLRPMDLVGGWSVAPLVDDTLRPWVLAAVTLAVAVLTAAMCAVGFTRFGRAARPAALREADR
jgi:hypothetical protein